MTPTPEQIAKGLPKTVKAAFLELQPSLEWQDCPNHKGNKQKSLCFAKERDIGPDAYVRLGRTDVRPNSNRQKSSDPMWISMWMFTPTGLSVRAILEAQNDRP